jgi:glycosyltransferase involved in cell wall biosynthesis
MIDSGVDGVLVPVEDPGALGNAIVEMIDRGPDRRRDMGAAGLARVRALSQPVVAQRWVNLFRHLATDGRRDRGSRRATS